MDLLIVSIKDAVVSIDNDNHHDLRTAQWRRAFHRAALLLLSDLRHPALPIRHAPAESPRLAH
jgi:hypothetical protein